MMFRPALFKGDVILCRLLRAGFGMVALFLISAIACASTTNDGSNTIKLKPKMRASKILKPQATLSRETLLPFIKMSLIFEDKNDFLKAPSVIAQDKNRIER